MAYTYNGTLRSDKGKVVWLDCPIHGTLHPFTYRDDRMELRYTAARTIPDKYILARCHECAYLGRPRLIKIRPPRPGKEPSRCSWACLHGQISCDCRCYWMCHGSGVCVCGTMTGMALDSESRR